MKTNRRVPASGGLSANAGANPFPRRGRGAECSLRTRGGYTLRERNPMGRVCTGLLLSISIMKPIHAMCRVYAGAAVTCATVQPVVSSLTFTDKRGMLLRAFSVAFAGSAGPKEFLHDHDQRRRPDRSAYSSRHRSPSAARRRPERQPFGSLPQPLPALSSRPFSRTPSPRKNGPPPFFQAGHRSS